MTTTTASIILQQLGDHRFRAMTGAKDLLALEDGLQFKVGANAQKVTAVRITLDATDLYMVQFYRGRGLNMVEAAAVTMVDAAALRGVFEEHTGMRTSL